MDNTYRTVHEALTLDSTVYQRPETTFMTVKDLLSKSRPLVEQIFEQHHLLHEIVIRHEATLRNRWTKKSKNKRRAILEEAWGEPTMPACHRPDIVAFKARPSLRDPNPQPYLTPHFNLEDMAKTEPLPLLFKTRGRHDPDQFVYIDLASCLLGLRTLSLDRSQTDGFFMMFLGRKTPETYGKLYPENKLGEISERDRKTSGLDTGSGLIVLTTQAKLYHFLVKCCQLLLHDIGGELYTSPIQPEPAEASAETSKQSWSDLLSKLALEAPYRHPADIDYKRFHAVFAARLDQAKNHLFSLRENPEHFSQYLKIEREKLKPKANEWGHAVRNVLGEALQDVERLSVLGAHLLDMDRLRVECGGPFSPRDDIPEEYTMGNYHLHIYLALLVKHEVGKVQEWFIKSPPMQKVVTYLPGGSADDKAPRYEMKKGATPSEHMTRIFRIFEAFLAELKSASPLPCLGLDTVFCDFQMLLKGDARIKELLTPAAEDFVSNVAGYIECYHQLELAHVGVQPMSQSMGEHVIKLLDGLLKDIMKPVKDISEMVIPRPLLELAKPENGRFSYPKSTQPSRGIVLARRAAEANLDAFWEKYMPLVREKARISHHTEEVFKRELRRTAEWEPATDIREPRVRADDDLAQATRGLQLREEVSQFATTEVAQTKTKTKTKTRGISNPPEELVTQEPSKDNGMNARETPKIKVDRRTARVLEALFFVESTPHKPGETDWSEFLYAMTKIGFAIRKGDGSAWKFTPRKIGDFKIPIDLHAPHGANTKISRGVARAIGRRLSYNYDLSFGSFELDG